MTKPDAATNLPRQAMTPDWKRMEAAMNYWLKPETPLIGQTPKDCVWTKNKSKLWRYRGEGPRRHATPLFMVYALINKPYILDLTPGNSLIEYLVAQGYDVFLLEWGEFGEEDQQLTLDALVADYVHRAARQVLKVSGASEFTLFGYCMGGTLSLMYAGAYPEMPIKNLVLLTTPVDFADAGLFSRWMNEEAFDVDQVVDNLGNVPPEFIKYGAKWLKPLTNFYGTYVQLWNKIDDPDFVKGWVLLDHWINDGIPFPGEAYRQWVKSMYQGNKLVKGEMWVRERPVVLKNLKMPILCAIAELDHIVQAKQATIVTKLVSSPDTEIYSAPAGHVGIVGTAGGKKHFYPKLDSWLDRRS